MIGDVSDPALVVLGVHPLLQLDHDGVLLGEGGLAGQAQVLVHPGG